MAVCFICLEPCVSSPSRAFVTLICGHIFHLACIGCSFNMKGAMECPVCRIRERSDWRFCRGSPSHPRFGLSSDDDEYSDTDDYDSDEISIVACSVEGCDCTGALSRQSHRERHREEQETDRSENGSGSETDSYSDSEQEVQIFRPRGWLRPLSSRQTWRMMSRATTSTAAEGSSSSHAPPPSRSDEVQGRGYEMYSTARRIAIGSNNISINIQPRMRSLVSHPFWRPEIGRNPAPTNFPGLAEAMGRGGQGTGGGEGKP